VRRGAEALEYLFCTDRYSCAGHASRSLNTRVSSGRRTGLVK
jgi:hypothetical protein